MYLRAFIPACEAFGWSGGPSFQTRLKVLQNGRERRNVDWSQEKNRYTLPFQNLGERDYAGIRQMFQVCRGMAHDFLYRDPLDSDATDEAFGIGDGVTQEFQLSKLSAIQGVIYQREIHALYIPGSYDSVTNTVPAVDAPITVYVNGTPTAVTLDRDRGLVLFAAAPAVDAVLTWSGEFSIWVRFDADWLPFSIDNRRGNEHAHNGQVVLLEDHAPPEVET